MDDAALDRMAKVGPSNARIAAALRPLNPGYRRAVMEIAREIGGERYGGWENIVVITAAAAQSGAQLRVFRELVVGRRWSLGTARYSGLLAESNDGDFPDG